MAAARTGSTRRTVATVRLPFVTAEFWLPTARGLRPPGIRVPRLSHREVGDAARVVASHLPPREQLAYYTGLGALALVQVVEWPVAVALGVGSAVVGRQARREAEQVVRARGNGQPTGTRPPAVARQRTRPAAPRQRTSAAPRQRTRPAAPRQRTSAAPRQRTRPAAT